MPTRMCLACRERAPQEQLIRIRRRNGGWAINEVASGRSVYWCGSSMCLDKIMAGRRLALALNTEISPEAKAALLPELSPYKR